MSDLENWIPMEDEGFIAHVGPLYHRPFDGGPTSWFRFYAEDKHRNRSGFVQGGMLMTFADRALGFTARRGDLSRQQATVQFDMHFIRSVRIGDTVDFEGHIVRETAALVFLRGDLAVAGDIVASAQGVWRVWKSKADAAQA